MAFSIFLTDSATKDIEEIIYYIAGNDSSEKANHVLNKIEEVLLSIKEMPHRGSYPKELASLGLKEYREVYFKPYRIIYRIFGSKIFVYLVVDGRRDMQSLLSRRLLSP